MLPIMSPKPCNAPPAPPPAPPPPAPESGSLFFSDSNICNSSKAANCFLASSVTFFMFFALLQLLLDNCEYASDCFFNAFPLSTIAVYDFPVRNAINLNIAVITAVIAFTIAVNAGIT